MLTNNDNLDSKKAVDEELNDEDFHRFDEQVFFHFVSFHVRKSISCLFLMYKYFNFIIYIIS